MAKPAATVCYWCTHDEKELQLKSYHQWVLYVSKGQELLGWSLAVLKRHCERFEELTDEELQELRHIIADTRRALEATFRPDLLNVMQLGNVDRHLHVHIVPRYHRTIRYAGRTFRDKKFGNPIGSKWKEESQQFLIRLTAHLRAKMPRSKA